MTTSSTAMAATTCCLVFGGNDTINGGQGDDLIEGGFGGDHLDGGDGVNTLAYSMSSGGRGQPCERDSIRAATRPVT